MDARGWIAVAAFSIMATGSVVGAVDYFAKSTDLQLIAERLEQKIVNDQLYDIQRQLWRFEDRYEGSPMSDWPYEDRERYRKLKYRWKMLQREGE